MDFFFDNFGVNGRGKVSQDDDKPDPEQELFLAASRGKIDRVSALLSARTSPFKLVNGFNCFHIAAKKKNLLIFNLILEQVGQNADSLSSLIDAQTGDGRTTLMLAAFEGSLEMIELLHHSGASISILDHVGNSSLHYAAWGSSEGGNHLAVCKYLIESMGLSPKCKNIEGMLPEHMAAAANSKPMVEYFIFLDAMQGRRDEEGSVEIQGESATSSDSAAGYNSLHRAAIYGSLDVVRLILSNESGIISSRSANGSSALHLAAQYGQLALMKCLIEEFGAADVNSANSFGLTPLHFSCMAGYADQVVYLLSKGADPSLRNLSGATPLHAAATSGRHELCRILFDSGLVDLSSVDSDGNTAIDCALTTGYKELASRLAGWSYVQRRSLTLSTQIGSLA